MGTEISTIALGSTFMEGSLKLAVSCQFIKDIGQAAIADYINCMLCQLVSLSILWSLVGRQVSTSILDQPKIRSGGDIKVSFTTLQPRKSAVKTEQLCQAW